MRYALFVVLVAACNGTVDEACPLNARCPNRDSGFYMDAAPPPMPAGCITEVFSGDHTYTCGGLQVDARIPARCQTPGCGLILVLHGDTGNGLLMDAHVKLRDLGEENGYIVIAPTGPLWTTRVNDGQPGSTWYPSNDATLVDITKQFRDVFRVDPTKIHVTGFSRGGFVTWRLLCDHADLFASAAPAGAGDASQNGGEPTCFNNNRVPSRKIPITFLMGRTDVAVGYTTMQTIRNNAIAYYAATGPTVIVNDPEYTHNGWASSDGAVIETWDHAYENYPTSAFASAKGHCIVGSTTSPTAPQYAIPCQLPTKFVWGDEVMKFFIDHPMP